MPGAKEKNSSNISSAEKTASEKEPPKGGKISLPQGQCDNSTRNSSTADSYMGILHSSR